MKTPLAALLLVVAALAMAGCSDGPPNTSGDSVTENGTTPGPAPTSS